MQLTIESAKGLKSVDSNGLSDPYIKVVHNYHGKSRTIFKTSTMKKTLDPIFSKETFRVAFPPTLLRLIAKDHNTFGDSKDMGEAEFDVVKAIGDIKEGEAEYAIDSWLPIGMGGSGSIHVVGSVTLGPVRPGNFETASLFGRLSISSMKDQFFEGKSSSSSITSPTLRPLTSRK